MKRKRGRVKREREAVKDSRLVSSNNKVGKERRKKKKAENRLDKTSD